MVSMVLLTRLLPDGRFEAARFLTAVALSIDFGAHEGEGLSAMRIMNRAAPGGM